MIAAKDPELLHITLNFTKPKGDFDFGLNVRTNYNDIKTVINIKRNSILSIDRSASGNTLGTDDFKL